MKPSHECSPVRVRSSWNLSTDGWTAFQAAGVLISLIMTAAIPAVAGPVVLKGAGHGFKGADVERAEQAIFTFFDTHLKLPAVP